MDLREERQSECSIKKIINNFWTFLLNFPFLVKIRFYGKVLKGLSLREDPRSGFSNNNNSKHVLVTIHYILGIWV